MRSRSEIRDLVEEQAMSALSLYSYYDLYGTNIEQPDYGLSLYICTNYKSLVHNMRCNLSIHTHYQGYIISLGVDNSSFNHIFKKYPDLDTNKIDKSLKEHTVLVSGEYEKYNPFVHFENIYNYRKLLVKVTVPYTPDDLTKGSDLMLDIIKECTALLDMILYQAFLGPMDKTYIDKYTTDSDYFMMHSSLCYNTILMNEDDGVELSVRDTSNYFNEHPTTIRNASDIDFNALNTPFIVTKNMLNMLKKVNKIKLFNNLYIERTLEDNININTDTPLYIRVNGKDMTDLPVNGLKLGKLQRGKLILHEDVKAKHLPVVEVTDYSIPMFRLLK